MSDLQSFFLSKLVDYKKKNRRHSLRSFAKKLKISPGHLSSLIHGRRKLTTNQVGKIVHALNLDAESSERLIQHTLPKDLRTNHPSLDFEVLTEDQLRLLGHGAHFAILSLSQIKMNRADPKWLSKKLGIDIHIALDAYLRLKRMGFITEIDGRFRQTSKHLATTRDIPSEVIRSFHKETLRIASEKIESVPITSREFASVTMAINPKKFQIAKDLIQKLQIQICKELEDEACSEVYTLAIQFFPISKPEEEQ